MRISAGSTQTVGPDEGVLSPLCDLRTTHDEKGRELVFSAGMRVMCETST